MPDFDTNVFAVPCLNASGKLTGSLIACPNNLRPAATDCTSVVPGNPCPACSGVTPLFFDCAYMASFPLCCGGTGGSFDCRTTVLQGSFASPKPLRQHRNNPCWWEYFDTSLKVRTVVYESSDGSCSGDASPPFEPEGVLFTLSVSLGDPSYWFFQVFTTCGQGGGYIVVPEPINCTRRLVLLDTSCGTGAEFICEPRRQI